MLATAVVYRPVGMMTDQRLRGSLGGGTALADFALCGQLSHDSEDRALLFRCLERDASGCQLLPQVALVAAVLADGSHDRVCRHDHRVCVGLLVSLAVVLHGACLIVARVERPWRAITVGLWVSQGDGSMPWGDRSQ